MIGIDIMDLEPNFEKKLIKDPWTLFNNNHLYHLVNIIQKYVSVLVLKQAD